MSSNASTMNYPANDAMARLIALENRTGYTMQQFNGQRKYWNPKQKDPIPPRGCEVFVGKIPRDLFEDELVPVFEKVGKLYELRLMMDFSGFNRGYAFVCYTCREHAQESIEKLDNYEIRPGQRIGVCRSVDNCRLFVGGIPKDKTQQEIMQAMCEISEDVSDVIVYPGIESGEANRGFAFVEYHTHRAAAMARRKLIPGRITIFGNEVVTDWAEPEVDANDTLGRIKNVYVRNLKITTSHHTIFSAFNAIRPGVIERVKKIEDRDYAFVHFMRREDALYAVQVMNGQIIDGQAVQVSLAKPPSNKRDVKSATITPVTQQQVTLPNNAFPIDAVQPPFCYDRLNRMLIPKTNACNPNSNPIPSTVACLSAPSVMPPVPPPHKQLASIVSLPNHNQTQQMLAMNLQHQPPPSNLTPIQTPFLNPLKLNHSMSTPNLSYQIPPAPARPPVLGLNDATVLNEFRRLFAPGNIQNNKSSLERVSTLDHISKIKCPVLYLDQLCSMFNNDVRPTYQLYCDESFGITRYVYQVSLMNKTYMPPSHMFSTSIAEARKNSARYVLDQLGPWLKLKCLEIVNGNRQPSQPSKPSTPADLKPFLPQPPNVERYPLLPLGLKSNTPSTVANGATTTCKTKPATSVTSDSSWKQWIAMNLPTCAPNTFAGNLIPRQSYTSLSANNDVAKSNSSLGLSDGLWRRLPVQDNSNTTATSSRSVGPTHSSLISTGLGLSRLPELNRQPSFDQAPTSTSF